MGVDELVSRLINRDYVHNRNFSITDKAEYYMVVEKGKGEYFKTYYRTPYDCVHLLLYDACPDVYMDKIEITNTIRVAPVKVEITEYIAADD